MKRLLLVALLAVSACTHGSTKPTAAASNTVWLCSPDMAHDPCDVPLASSVVHPNGTTSPQPAPTTKQPVDCFYVYPTVSQAQTTNAPLRAEAAEKRTATAQVARFSSVCRVFAPVYRQLTVHALLTGKYFDAAGRATAHADVLAAWHDYLADNPNRRFVLIGHSQGSLELLKLLQEEIDGNAKLRGRLVSALLLGGNMKVKPHAVVGGDLRHIPLCTSDKQNGCVVTYNAFSTAPTASSFFGRPDNARGLVAACTNPAALAGGSGPLLPYFPAGANAAGVGTLPGAPAVKTGFTTYPDYVTARCRTRDGFAWLEVTTHPVARDTRPRALPLSLGADWGLHLVDVNIALGNLVDLVRRQSG